MRVAGFTSLQMTLWLPVYPSCAPGMVDQHGPLLHFLSLAGKKIVSDAVAGIELLMWAKRF